jgi:hypothetical protein
MSLGIAVLLVVVCFGALAIGFGHSMHNERQRRQQVKSKWSATPRPGAPGSGGGHGSH